MRYWWKVVSSLILPFTILKAEMESLMGPGRTICMRPYGSKTTKVDVKDLKPLDWLPASVTSGLLPCPDLCCGWS